MNVLNSKLTIPKRKEIFSRHRLTRLFEDNMDKKVFVVTAGAGFGKTTLVVDALARMDLDSAWYRLDEQDTDFHVFMAYLYSLMGHPYPGYSGEKTDKFNPSGPVAQANALTEWLTFMQQQVCRPSVIVLDDYHLVQDSEAINSAVDFILHRLPDLVKVVIIGRRKLPLSLSKIQVEENLEEIDEADLCFSKQEIEQFFMRQIRMAPADIDDVQETTKGWAASLVLLKHAILKQPHASLSESISKLSSKPDFIFSYLEENVFDSQPAYIQEFMMKMALLPEIDSQRCRDIFNIEDAGQILGRMIEDHLMVFPVDESGAVFSLHHLFRDFLLQKLHAHFPVNDIKELHCRIAASFELDDIDLALHHFVAGQDYDQAIRILEENEMDFQLRGKVKFIDRIHKQIPQEIIDGNPRILLSQSRICSHFGDSETAIALTSKAMKQLRHQKADDKIADSVVELGMQYYYTGHLKEAKLMMEQVIDGMEKASQAYIIAMTFLTFLPSILGEFETSREHERAARKTFSDYPELEKTIAFILLDTSLTHTLFFMGDFETSQQLSHQLLHRMIKMDVEFCLPLVYYQLSVNCFFMGDWDTGCRYGEKGVAICEKMSLSDARKAWNHLAWAQNYSGLGQFQAAQEQLDLSIRLFEGPGNRWGLASAQECQAEIYLKQNRTGPALKILEDALDLINGYGLKVTQGILENRYAQVLMAEDRYCESLKYLSSARPNLTGASYHLFTNHLFAARACWNLEQTEKSLSHLSAALALCKTYSYSRHLIENREWIVAANTKGSRLSSKTQRYVERLFHQEIKIEPGMLKINLFGKFSLHIGSQKLGAASWKSSKALILFKYLAANQGQGYVPKDFLLELLWPEQDPDKTGSRFNMAMSSLRKTLEPGIKPKAPSAYIDRKKDTYRLFADLCRVDTDLFSSLILKAKKASPDSDEALDCYLDACDLFKGQFLEEDLYEEWCIEKRQYFLGQYIDALQALICRFEAQNKIEQAIFYSQKLMAVSPLDETAACRLMQYYLETDALSKAISTYKTFVSHSKRMDLPVGRKITTLYQNLVEI